MCFFFLKGVLPVHLEKSIKSLIIRKILSKLKRAMLYPNWKEFSHSETDQVLCEPTLEDIVNAGDGIIDSEVKEESESFDEPLDG